MKIPELKRFGIGIIGILSVFSNQGPVLPILERDRCVCPFVSGLHRLLWQHWIFLLGLGGQKLHPNSLSTLLSQLSNMLTGRMSVSNTQ
jgi:hypothetical protein